MATSKLYMTTAHLDLNPMIGMSWHDGVIVLVPPVPMKALPHIDFNILRGLFPPTSLMAMLSKEYWRPGPHEHGEIEMDSLRGLARGNDAGFFSPHISIPINNSTLPFTYIFGSSISIFGSSSVKIPAYNSIFGYEEADVGASLFPYVGLNIACNDWPVWPTPTNIAPTWSTVMVGVTFADFVAALVDFAIEVFFSWAGEAAGDWVGSKIKKIKAGRANELARVGADPAQEAAQHSLQKSAKEGLGEVPVHKRIWLSADDGVPVQRAMDDKADELARKAPWKDKVGDGTIVIGDTPHGLRKKIVLAQNLPYDRAEFVADQVIWNLIENGGLLAGGWGLGKLTDAIFDATGLQGEVDHPQPTLEPDLLEAAARGGQILERSGENHWYTDMSPIPMKVTFSQRREDGDTLQDFTAEDVSTQLARSGSRLRGACAEVGNFRKLNDFEYTFDLTPNEWGRDQVVADIEEDVCFLRDRHGLEYPNKAAQQCRIERRLTAPAVSLSSPAGTATPDGSVTSERRIPITARFDREVEGFSESHVRLSNASLVPDSFRALSRSEYRFEIEVAGSGEVEAQVVKDAAQDAERRKNGRSALFRIRNVPEQLTARITTPGGETAESPIPVRVAFDGEVPAFDASKLRVSGGSVHRVTPAGASDYDVEIVPTAAGEPIEVSLAPGSVADKLGRTLAEEARAALRFVPDPDDALLESGGKLLTSRYPGLSAFDRETLSLGMKVMLA